MSMPQTTRFAPSPSGLLHLGHAYAALFAARAAGEAGAGGAGGRFLLRIEDIDAERARPEYEDAILADLAWLGLAWAKPPRRPSDHLPDYPPPPPALEARGQVSPRDPKSAVQATRW